MKIVKIYLRSVEQTVDGKVENHLAMFDSNGVGAIDNLITDVQRGDTVIWKLDRLSGIRSIAEIFFKKGDHHVFKSDPRKRFLCKGFKLQVPIDAEEGMEEYSYTIEYKLREDTDVIIDPYIRVPPPPAG
jgi:hypothetical protein